MQITQVFQVAEARRPYIMDVFELKAVAWQPEPSEVTAGAWPSPPRGTWREAGAGNRGVDDGFSDWMDRLEALGDSIVPQITEWIGRQIIASRHVG